MKPNSAKVLMVTAVAAAEKRRSRNSEMSSIGWSATVSSRMKTASSNRVPPKPSTVWVLVQPASGASMMVHVSRPSMAIDTAIPGLSSGGTCGSRDSGTNADCHRDGHGRDRDHRPEDALPGEVLEQPAADDRSGGDADSGRGTPDGRAAAARSRRSVNALAMIDSVVGKITAAQAPAANRVATSAPDESASAEAALARPKPSRPRISAGRRPNRSDRLPAASTSAAKARL